MAFISPSLAAARGKTWQAIAMLLVLTIIGALNINVFDRSIALTFIPLIGLVLWPRYVNAVAAIISLLFLGLLLDFLTAEPLAMRSIIYLVIFTIFRPDLRTKMHHFGGAFLRWLMIAIIAFILIFLLGWFAMDSRPDIWPLLQQLLAATLLFPIIYGARHFLRIILSDPDDRGF